MDVFSLEEFMSWNFIMFPQQHKRRQTGTFCQDAGGENSPQRGNVNEVRFTPCGGVKVVFQ